MFGDMAKLMKIAGELRTKLPQMQEAIAKAKFSADAGGGAVSATVSGRGVLLDLKVSPEALADCDGQPELLADLVRAAVRSAQEKAAGAAKDAMKELTGGVEIPGLTDMI